MLGAVAVAWFAILLQPCAMALAVDDHDCPHCPPVETRKAMPCEVSFGDDCAFEEELKADPPCA